MKKVFSLVLAVMMLAAVFALAASAMVGEGYHNYGEIANVERKSIRLDVIKESAYDAATPIPIKYQTLKTNGKPNSWYPEDGSVAPVEGVAYVVYDTEYIWVYAEITDATLNTKAADALSSSVKEDSLEIMIDWTNEGLNVPNGTPYQSRVSHEGYISARLGQQGTTMQGTAEQGSPNPVNWLQGTGAHTEKGYNCEFRIDIPENVTIGEYISIGFMINDRDADGNKRIMVTSDPVTGFCEWQVDRLGYIKFNYAPYTGDNTIYYVVAAMVAALAVGAVTVVTLKRRVASK